MHKLCSNECLANAGLALSAVALLASCVYTYVNSQQVSYKMAKSYNASSTAMMSMFSRAVAITCALSRVAIVYRNCTSAIRAYERKIDNYTAHFSPNADKTICRRTFVSVVVTVCAVTIVPVNACRMYSLNLNYPGDHSLIVFFMLMYLQNVSMCITEVRFVVHCFRLYQEFQSINEEMSAVKAKTIAANRYPPVLKPDHWRDASFPARHNDDDDDDEFCARIELCSMFDVIEQFKMRHQFVREAVRTLNELYKIQMGMALCVLFFMTLFDIYHVVSNGFPFDLTNLFVYGCLAQYAFRFCTIILTTHFTSKQVMTVRARDWSSPFVYE